MKRSNSKAVYNYAKKKRSGKKGKKKAKKKEKTRVCKRKMNSLL